MWFYKLKRISKIFSIITMAFIFLSCSQKVDDNTPEGVTLAQKSRKIIITDMNENDSIDIGTKKYYISELPSDYPTTRYRKRIVFSEGTKLKIETAEMSKDKITELLLSRKATEATVAQFMALLANCEMARYSQHHTNASMEKDFSEAVQVISALDKQVKNK